MSKIIEPRLLRLYWWVALLLAGSMLRVPMTSLASVVAPIGSMFRLSELTIGLLTALPVACLALAPLAVHRFASRIGRERSLVWAIAAIAMGTAVRLLPLGSGLLLATALVSGLGIAAAQTLIAPIAAARLGNQAPALVAGSLTTMAIGAAAGAWATPALAMLTGFAPSLALWAVPMTVAWFILVRARSKSGPVPDAAPVTRRIDWRDKRGWRIGLLGAAVSACFWGMLAWSGPALAAAGYGMAETGALLAGTLVAQICGTMLLSIHTARSRSRVAIGLGFAWAAAIGAAMLASEMPALVCRQWF